MGKRVGLKEFKRQYGVLMRKERKIAADATKRRKGGVQSKLNTRPSTAA